MRFHTPFPECELTEFLAVLFGCSLTTQGVNEMKLRDQRNFLVDLEKLPYRRMVPDTTEQSAVR